VNIDEGKIVMEKSQKVLDEIAGSLYLPQKYKNKPIDFIIRDSKQEYFAVKK